MMELLAAVDANTTAAAADAAANAAGSKLHIGLAALGSPRWARQALPSGPMRLRRRPAQERAKRCSCAGDGDCYLHVVTTHLSFIAL